MIDHHALGALDFQPTGDGIEMGLVVNQIIRETEEAAGDLVRSAVS